MKKEEKNINMEEIDVDLLSIFKKSLNTLRDVIATQCSDGNWNYDPYMHGMANGMIFALSLFDNKRPEYLDAPDVWLCDIPNDEEPVSENDITSLYENDITSLKKFMTCGMIK